MKLATELSYLLWGSMPDDELFALAESGALSDPVTVRAQVQRMLLLAQSGAGVSRFFRAWLGVGSLQTQTKDPDTFPMFTPEVRDALLAEYDQLVVRSFLEAGDSLSSLLTSESSWINGVLAAYYGVELGADQDFAEFAILKKTSLKVGSH